ncbi:hypothetical protein FKM82_010701 [Ascaphus truei]
MVLLDWVSHTLVGYHTKKLDLEDTIVQKLWGFLDNIVHSKKLQSLVKEGKSVNLRFTIVQVINDLIAASCTQEGSKAGIGTVLSCCQGILSIPALAFVYTAKCELMVELLSKLSTLACQSLSSEEPITPQVFDVLQMSFNQYLHIQMQQNNPNRVFGHVVAQLFQPCLLVRHALNTHVWGKLDNSRVRYQLSKEIRSKVEAVLQMGLFQADLLSSYKVELLPEKDQSEKKKGSLKILLTPVHSLLEKLGNSSFCGTEVHSSVVANSVPLLYKLFLDSYCKDGNQLVCFHMLVRLFECLQTSAAQEELAVSSWGSMGLFALEQLLNLLLSHDIYNVAVDRIRHQEVQYHFYRKLAEMLVYSPRASIPAWFRCLKTLILLNHLIVEPDLDDLVSCAWVDADIVDVRVKKAQEVLISSLLQTYAKLRQFPRLFEEILTVICRPASDELRQPVLSPGLTAKLSECLLELPPNQILDIWAMILGKCHTVILPDVEDDPDLCIKLVSLSTVLHCLLFNMKSMDNNTPVPVLLRFQSLMEKMMEELIKPSLNLVNDHSTETDPPIWLLKLVDATLLFIYTWIEVNIMTTLNCSKYNPHFGKFPTPSDSPVEGWDFSSLIGDKACWEKLVVLTAGVGSVSKYCLGLLSVQKIKQILMQIRFPTETDLLTLRAAASFVFRSGGQRVISEDHESWNGSASTVNINCFPVAHWHLIASNFLILHPYISTEDTNYVADLLLETLPSQQDEEDQGTAITFAKVSASLLRSSFFSEMRVLQCAFITSIIKKCATVLDKDEQSALTEILCQLSAESLLWHVDFFSNKRGDKIDVNSKCNTSNDNSSMCWKNMENAAQNVLCLARSLTYVSLSESNILHLQGMIEFLSVINPDSLTPSDQSRCFLLLLSLARADNSPRSLHLVSICYRLLTHLLSGKHSNAVFKLLYASDVLEIVMTSLLMANQNIDGSSGRNQEWPEFMQTIQSFLESFLGIIIERKQSLLLNLEKFSAFVVSCIPDSDSKLWNPHVGQLFLVALNTLCQVITPYLQEQHANKQLTETLSSLLQQAVVKMGEVVQQCLKVSVPAQILPSFFVACTTTLLEAELSHLSCTNVTKMDSISVSCKVGLQNLELYRSFCSQILRELFYADGQIAFLKNALHYLTICITVKEIHPQESIVIAIFSSLKKLLTGPWISVQIVQSLAGELIELFTQLAQSCSIEEFYIMMKLVLQGLEVSNLWKHHYKEAFAAITVIRLLLICPLNGDNGKLFWFTAPQIITALVVTLQPAVKKHLTEGIFHILDLCIDRDIKFLNASLQMGVREVFKELYNEYTHYHKTKNQGEEKYTA